MEQQATQTLEYMPIMLYEGGRPKACPEFPNGFPMHLMNEKFAQKTHNLSLWQLAARGGMSLLEILSNVTRQRHDQISITHEAIMGALVAIAEGPMHKMTATEKSQIRFALTEWAELAIQRNCYPVVLVGIEDTPEGQKIILWPADSIDSPKLKAVLQLALDSLHQS